jgi:hypothetical protein
MKAGLGENCNGSISMPDMSDARLSVEPPPSCLNERELKFLWSLTPLSPHI